VECDKLIWNINSMEQLMNEQTKKDSVRQRNYFDAEKKKRDNPYVEITRLREELKYSENKCKTETDKRMNNDREKAEVTSELDSMQKRMINLNADIQEAMQDKSQMMEQLKDCLDRNESLEIKQKNELLEKDNRLLRSDLWKEREMLAIATRQIDAMKTRKTLINEQIETLEDTLRDMTSGSELHEKYGILYNQLVNTKWSSA
jgi:chromosome segregation ATPase